MIKKVGLLMVLLSSSFISCFAQRDNIWMLGYGYNGLIKAGIDFTNGNSDTFSLDRPMPFYLADASICDTTGQLIFYSNGIYIANRLHDTLQNSKNFNPGYYTLDFATDGLNMKQPMVILPYPGSQNKFIIFHESADTCYNSVTGIQKMQTLFLRYSVIDMNLDSGLGGIIPGKKSIVLINDTIFTGMLVACKHANGRDWWILTQRYNDSLFYKILLTPDTIEISTQQIGFPVIWDFAGQSVFSPDGSKYVMLSSNKLLDVYDFDRCAGMLSNYKRVAVPDTTLGYVGASISPSNKYLYINTQLAIYQYDLLSSNIDSSVQIAAIIDSISPQPFCNYLDNQCLGPDGKIYICTWNGCDHMVIINQPDSEGVNCDVLQSSYVIPDYNTAIPTFPNYNLGRLQGSACDTLQWAAVQEYEGIRDFKIYPNPVTSNILNIGYMLPQNKGGAFQIYDITGKVVFKYNLPQWSHLQKFNLPDLSDGVYSCVITSGTYRVSKKMVVIRE